MSASFGLNEFEQTLDLECDDLKLGFSPDNELSKKKKELFNSLNQHL